MEIIVFAEELMSCEEEDEETTVTDSEEEEEVTLTAVPVVMMDRGTRLSLELL